MDLYNDLISRFYRARPVKMTVYLTHLCNARCSMCNIWRERAPGELTRDEYREMLADPFFQRVGRITISGGEAFLREDFNEIVETFVKQLPRLRKITIATNGIQTGMIVKKVERLLAVTDKNRIDLALQISVDGIGDEHDLIRGVKQANAKVRRTIDELSALAAGHRRLKLMGNCVIQPANLATVNEVADYFNQKGIDSYFAVVTTGASYYNNMENEGVTFDSEQIAEVRAVLAGLTSATRNPGKRLLYDEFSKMLAGATETRGCPMLREVISIEYDGKIVPCINAEGLVLGDIRTGPPAEIWSRRKNIITQVKEEICPSCMSACGVGVINAGLYGLRHAPAIIRKS